MRSEKAEAFFARLGARIDSLREHALPDSRLPAGAVVGPYRIVEPIGSGGMGVVYRATDPRLGRDVALKFLPSHLATDPRAARRFRAEAQAAASLDHPNVCTVHEIGETEDGRPFLAMVLYGGETLKARLERGPLPVEEAVRVGADVAQALEAAHEHGIIHRDVKPGNIMLGNEGRVTLLDFGLARIEDATLTRPGVLRGTVAYMAPEQVLGEDVGPWTDLWALGVVLHEMVAGRRPFGGEGDRAVFRAILEDEVRPLDEAAPGVPAWLAAVVARLLQREPAERYASAVELLADLDGGAGVLSSAGGRQALAGRRGQSVGRRGGAWALTHILQRIRDGEGANRFPSGPGMAAGSRIATTALLVTAVGTAAWLWLGTGTPTPSRQLSFLSSTASSTKIDHTREIGLAVLPFENESPSPDGAYFAGAMTDEINSALARLPGFHVVSGTSAAQFANAALPVRQIADSLGVAYLLEGSARQNKDQMAVLVRLVDARNDSTAWQGRYQRPLRDLLDTEVDIARQVSESLRSSFTKQQEDRLRAYRSADPIALELFLRARQLVRRFNYGMPEIDESLDLLRKSVARDRSFAAAYLELASRFHLLDQLRTPVWVDWGDSSRAAFSKAIRFARVPAQRSAYRAYRARALGELDTARSVLEQAVRANPNEPTLLGLLATTARDQGDLPSAVRWGLRARDLDPLNTDRWRFLGEIYSWLGLDQEAQRALRKATLLDRMDWSAWKDLIELRMVQDRFDAAMALDDTLARVAEAAGVDSHVDPGTRARVLLRLGHYRRARQLLEAKRHRFGSWTSDWEPDLLRARILTGDTAPRDLLVPQFSIAPLFPIPDTRPVHLILMRSHAALGHVTEATRQLKDYLRLGGSRTRWLTEDPALDAVRSDSMFQAPFQAAARRIALQKERVQLFLEETH